MQSNANRESRSQIKRRICQFSRTASILDFRPEESTRRHRAERYERKHKTNGKRSHFEARPSWTEVTA